MVAGATLARIWPTVARLREMRRLSDWIEGKVDDLPPSFAPLTDAVCYVGALSGRDGAFKKNIERVIRDPYWRARDYERQLTYHRGYKILSEHIAFHFVTRAAHPHILCNDVGRVISVYPELVSRGGFGDVCALLKQETMKSLMQADLKGAVRGRVEDMIEQGAT